jgi:signal transduction histidine kinase
MARVSISDQGPGIPPDRQVEIFDKFVRLERDLNSQVRGSGLGLYISRQLVEAMQGTITIESSGIKGEGSTFSFTLPLADGEV